MLHKNQDDDANTPTSRTKPENTARVLGLLPVISIIFFSVAGGPYGTEHLVQTAGPLFSVLSLALIPWFWGVPVGLLTAELGTAFPGDGGYVTWVREAFGDFWGFHEGMWSWCSGVCDNAIYPVLMVDYFVLGTGLDVPWVVQWLVKSFISTALTFVNLCGIEVVGAAAVIVNVLVMAPFGLLFLGGLDKMHLDHWDDTVPSVDVQKLIHVVLWNYNGFDAISTLGSEIKSPEKTIPKALMWSTALCMGAYILPVLVATSLDGHYTKYDNGHYGVIAGDTLGASFHAIFFASASISCVGMYLAEVATDSANLAAMADLGLLPRFLGRRVKGSRTPHVAILLQWAIVLCLITLPFDAILMVDNWLYSLALIVEVLALFQLRRSHAHVSRPLRIPLEGNWLVAAYVPTLCLCCFAVGISEWETHVIGVCLIIALSVMYAVFTRMKKHKATI